MYSLFDTGLYRKIHQVDCRSNHTVRQTVGLALENTVLNKATYVLLMVQSHWIVTSALQQVHE
jgi:hypothetical protein